MPANPGYQIKLAVLFRETIPGGDLLGSGNLYGASTYIESAVKYGLHTQNTVRNNTIQRYFLGLPTLGQERLLDILNEVYQIQEEIRQDLTL